MSDSNTRKNRTILTYNQNAKQIAEKSASNFKNYKSLVDKFLKELRYRECPRHGYTSILDLGCGSGEAAAYMHQSYSGFKAMGVDLSEGMLTEARKNDVQVRNMDIEDLQFSPAYFDGIWSMCSLVHLEKEKMPKVLSSLHNILKSDGRLFVCLKLRSEIFVRSRFGGLVCVADQDGIPTESPAWFEEKDHRYFSYWEKQEFLDVSNPLFKVVESSEINRSDNDVIATFLWFLLKKK